MIQQMQQVQGLLTSTSKPFFTVIIPSYNSGKTLPSLLQSLVNQQLSKQDLQVIVSDDCSTINYDYVIDSFKDKLNIKKVLSPYNGGVGNARQNGIKYANGRYITFIDSDDIYKNKVFQEIRSAIIKNPEIEYLTTGLDYLDADDNNKLLMRYNPFLNNQQSGYLHGKFFHLENFWKKYGLYFPKDLRTHQDIAIACQLTALKKIYPEIKDFRTDLVTYIWYKHSKSLTNRMHYYKNETQPRPFYDIWFNNYVKGTLDIFLDFYKKHQYDNEKGFQSCCRCLYLIYERSIRNLCYNSIIEENYDYLQSSLVVMLEQFNKNILDIKKYFLNNRQLMDQIKFYAMGTSGPYRHKVDFLEWLDLVYNKQLSKKFPKEKENKR